MTEVPTAAEGEVEEVARAVARRMSPEPAPAPPTMSPKDTRDSAQYRASNQTQPGRGFHADSLCHCLAWAEKLYPTTPVYPRWDGNYGFGVLHHEHIKDNERKGPRSPSVPSAPGQHDSCRGEDHVPPRHPPVCVWGVVTGRGTHPPLGWSRPSVGGRRSGPSRATRTQDDAEVEERDRGIRAGPTGPRCGAARHGPRAE